MNTALVLSGGSGSRMGMEIPKQYIEVKGRKIISYVLERLFFHAQIDGVQIVAAKQWQDSILEEMDLLQVPKEKWRGFSEPGKTRQWSILHGLEDIRKYASPDSYVLIHDAARPLLSKELLTACLEAAYGFDGAIPVLPVKDTMYLKSEDGKRIEHLIDRSRIVAGQSPEAFVLQKYYEANRSLLPEKLDLINGSTEPAILFGMNMAIVEGEEKNYKITTAEDLERFMTDCPE